MYNSRNKLDRKISDTKNVDSRPASHSNSLYPYSLNFYDKPPGGDVSVEEFETYALDRLRVLAEIESSFVRNRPFEELQTVTLDMCRKYLPLDSNSASTDTQLQRRKDHVGHFVLRLAFCRSEELRRRFIKAEMTLFRVRFEDAVSDERTDFLKDLKLDWKDVEAAEKIQYSTELKAALPGAPKDYCPAKETYYKVKWTLVPDLVEKRKVFLKGGFAYVPQQWLSSIVFQHFHNNLTKQLEMTAKALPRLDEDTRLVPILDNLSQGFLAGVSSEWSSATAGDGSEVTADMIDDLAKRHFPMCMRNLHVNLQRDHHLKHFGRLQYGLFLKVLGLSIDEALIFWRKSFSNIQDDKFNKEYRYNIRHSYGLEGKRANYPAKSCQQILISDQPGTSDSHGCPYRHFSPDNLQTALVSMFSNQGLTESDLPEIMHAVKSQHYHVACTRVFEITHASQVKKGEGMVGGESVTHPNQYASRSRELERNKLNALKKEQDDVVMS